MEPSARLVTKRNVRLAVRHLWGTLRSLSGALDVLGTVVVTFFIHRVPGLSDIGDKPWFTPAVLTAGATLLALLTSLRAVARIDQLEQAERARHSDWQRKIASLQGDINGLLEQMQSMIVGSGNALRTLDARWPGFEHLCPDLDAVNEKVKIINYSVNKGRNPRETVIMYLEDLRPMCRDLLERLHAMKGEAPP